MINIHMTTSLEYEYIFSRTLQNDNIYVDRLASMIYALSTTHVRNATLTTYVIPKVEKKR